MIGLSLYSGVGGMDPVGQTNPRMRIFVVAYSYSARCKERCGAESEREGFGAAECGRGVGGVADSVAGTLKSRLERVSDRIAARLDAARWPAPRLTGIDASGNVVTLPSPQHEWEPPRTTSERELRRKRLKAIGNICSPYQAFPIFAVIVELDAMLTNAIQTV